MEKKQHRFLSIGQVAELIGNHIGKDTVSKKTVKNMVKEGRLNPPDFRMGNRPFWKKKPITDWIESGKFMKG
ncbi:hypothetical protein FACS189427_13500 [Planctomycetales bacterium]|nr:hypothetical protein FACS189427_13500 [Planctomycetales bacterium]